MAADTHSSDRGPDRAGRHRFVAVQAGKAAVGVALGLAFFGLAGRPDAAEAVALLGLGAPALLGLLGLTAVPLAVLEQLGLALFAGLIGWLAILSGGVVSPVTVWFALVPAEAALAGGRRAVVKAGIAAGLAFAVVVAVQALGALPPSRLEYQGALPPWEIYACSMLAALVQAVLIAAAAQDRQRAADAKAAQGAAMYRFLADNAMDLITRHSSDGRIRFASPAALALLGRLPDEITGLALPSLVHPEDLNAVQSALMEASYFGRDGQAEIRLRHKQGHYLWVEMRCRPTRAPLGETTDIVAVTRDISERKRQERALVEARDAALDASRAKSRFLANMSHELRTPLNAVIGFSEVMTREMFGPIGPRYQEYSRLIHESGSHLLELINTVLDMSKIEAGKFELHEELFDLGETVESAVRVLKIPAERAGVALQTAIAPQTRLVFADRRAIKQVLVNLLSNGVKYTPRGGMVRVGAHLDRGVVLTVADTGTGISKSDLARLGQAFEQVESAQTRAREGTGLGLALVKSLAALHGGEAVLESVLGEGTTVTVRLPFAAVDEQGKPAGGEATGKVIAFRTAS